MDSFRQSRKLLFRLVFVLLTLTGCASGYREPSLPHNATASIKATAPIWIAAIDGKKVSRVSLSGNKQFRVTPGLHVVEVLYNQIDPPAYESSGGETYAVRNQAYSAKNVPIQFLATAGTAYYVKARRSEDSWKPIITDIPEPPPR
jgi:hypothetical protein